MDAHDHVSIGAITAGAIGLVKIMESLVSWASKKVRPGKEKQEVTLAVEPSRMLRETYEHASHVSNIVSLRDGDGIPMVYTPRSALQNQLKMAEAIRDIEVEHRSNHLEVSRKIDEILSSLKSK